MREPNDEQAKRRYVQADRVDRVFIIPAHTLAMARNALRKEIPGDWTVLWRHPDTEEKPRFGTAYGASLDEARRNIASLLPAGADTYESVREMDAYTVTLRISSFPEELERKVAAAATLQEHDEILDTRLVTKGSRGVAGLFKKPDLHEISIRRQALIHFKIPRKTTFVFVTGDSKEEYYCERCRRIYPRAKLKKGYETVNREFEREVWRCLCDRVIEAGTADWV